MIRIRPCRKVSLMVAGLALVLGLAGCATSPLPAPPVAAPPVPSVPRLVELTEAPAPPGAWREHRLARCTDDVDIPAPVEKLLALSSALFRKGAGSDAIVELELAYAAGQHHPLVLATMGQLYLMAGQGEPSLLPHEGPARDVGSWARNQPRLLGRARMLLEAAGQVWPDDAGIDYLLADIHRSAGDTLSAAALVACATAKCTGGRSFRVMQLYQQLKRYPARHEGGPPPVYPPDSLDLREQGEVVVDLLLSPAAEVRQAHIVSTPSEALAAAAAVCLRQGRFTPARLGKYPVWSWLRVTVAFRLQG
jgi:hypothetical protein